MGIFDFLKPKKNDSVRLDNKTPTIAKRIDIMTALAAKGWKIGLRFDPLIHGKNWKKSYQELFETVFVSVPLKSIHSVSFGSLRFPKQMFKNILYTVLFFMFGYFIFLITIYTGGVRQWGMFFIFFLM